MTHYDRLKRKRLGDILVDEGVATRDLVIRALHDQKESKRLLTDILIESTDVTEYEVARVIVDQYQMPFVDLESYTFHKDLIEGFPARLLHLNALLPLDRFGQQVCFACQEVPSEEVAAELRKYATGGLYFFVALSLEIRQALAEHAPLNEDDLAAIGPPPAPSTAMSAEKVAEDTAWKELFDHANESVLTDLDE